MTTNREIVAAALVALNPRIEQFDMTVEIDDDAAEHIDNFTVDDNHIPLTVSYSGHDNYSFAAAIVFKPDQTVEFYDAESDAFEPFPSLDHLVENLVAQIYISATDD